MNILDKIIERKKEEVASRKILVPVNELKNSKYFHRDCLSMKASLLRNGATGIIAEFKKRSPSKGNINENADVAKITSDYAKFGASGLSVLTDHEFFGGSNEDLIIARENNVPILRKDFIIDPYQILAAKAIGADVILLIAACLTVSQVKELAGVAKENGLEVLLELHEEAEVAHICKDIDMTGINNRSLKTFEVDIQRAINLSATLPSDMVKVAESGISKPEDVKVFRDAGYKGFLIGENFMKESDPGKAFEQFVQQLK